MSENNVFVFLLPHSPKIVTKKKNPNEKRPRCDLFTYNMGGKHVLYWFIQLLNNENTCDMMS